MSTTSVIDLFVNYDEAANLVGFSPRSVRIDTDTQTAATGGVRRRYHVSHCADVVVGGGGGEDREG